MKKRPCLLDSDWKKFNENTTDFLKKSYSRKKRKSSKNNLHSATYSDNFSFESFPIDGNISWQSSLEENVDASCGEKSPVIGVKQPMLHSRTSIKSTPAGSPILSQKHKVSSSVKEFPKKLSLFPLSPITPGTYLNFSFQNSSHISINVDEENNNLSHDRTPLAFPLPDSDGEIVEDDSTLVTSLQSDDIEAFSTQDNNSADSSHISTTEEVLVSSCMNETDQCYAKVKGSEWLENVMEKLDESCPIKYNFSALQPSVCYDSSKKQKFMRNGMAERLQNVIKQEQTSRILFKHKLKELQKQEASSTSMELKVVSHHKEYLLHILECKVLSQTDASNKSKFYTVIMNHDDVIENGIDLMTVFTIYPPWKEIRLIEHNFPVLICVYHVIVDQESTLSATTSQSQLDSQDDAYLLQAVDNSWTRDCESLLEALEKQDHSSGICLAATVQRRYQQPTSSEVRWVWLCEDAFGVFFELSLETSLCDDETWSRLIKQGEGQRLYFQKLVLTGRTSRSCSPTLFTLIDSVWDPEGFGLQQVQNSQSQNTDDSDTQHLVQAPSFCYQFIARRWQTFCRCFSTHIDRDVISIISELNRPRIDGSTTTDVLYRKCVPLLCADASGHTSSLTTPSRCSLLGSIFHLHLSDHSESISQSGDCGDVVFIIDQSSSSSDHIIPIILAPHHGSHHLSSGDGIFMKDLLTNPDDHVDIGYRTDSYSYVCILDRKTCTEKSATILLPQVLCGKEIMSRCFGLKVPPMPYLNKNTSPGQFAEVSGVICGLTVLSTNKNPPSSSDENNSILKKPEKSSSDNNNFSSEKFSFELLLMITSNIKVKLKCLFETVLKLLPSDSAKLSTGKSSLNGMKFSSVNSYVYAKYVKTHMTLFYAEEVSFR